MIQRDEAPLISIIVPVYNVEKYLNDCVESLVQQSQENIEIILVDDGSIDHSGSICDLWAERDGRIRVFHKMNGGLSDARNFGIAQAQAEYILLVDSDDCINSSACDDLYKIQMENNPDMISFKVVKFFDIPPKNLEGDTGAVTMMDSTEAGIEYLYGRYFQHSACSKFYRKEILQSVVFPVGKLAEDYATTYLIIDKCKRVAYYDKTLYYYRTRPGSIMQEKSIGLVLDVYETSCKKYEFEMSRYPAHASIIETAYANCLLKTMARLTNEGKDEYQKVRGEIQEKLSSICWSRTPLISRVVYTLYRTNKKVFAFAMKLIGRNG